jgi:putative nucleotidyltransferase with HDIG domain
MNDPRVVLAATTPVPRTWSATAQLQIGRLPELDVAIDHPSVSRRHAEMLLTEDRWVVRDLGSTNGTHLNSVRIGRTPQRVRQGDVVRVGDIDLRVEFVRGLSSVVPIGGGRAVQVEAASRRTWDEALDGFDLSDERWLQDGKAFFRLMRAGYRLAHATTSEAHLQQVLSEAVVFFQAQRGGIFLTDPSGSQLIARFVASPPGAPAPALTLSRTPSVRAFTGRQSLLFKDCQNADDLQAAESVARGSMTSIICAVLRSPERVYGVLHLDRGLTQESFTEEDLSLADSLAAGLALGIERFEMIDRQQEVFLHTVTALAQAVEMRDLYTGDHTHRVTTYSLLLAEELGLSAEERHVLRAAAALHDIGKIAIDDDILRKPGRLSEPEFTQMKTHVTRGAEIIQMVPGLTWALPVVRGHHERWDGTGYPDRLQGEAIPLLARVVCVADAFDAMTSDRPYRKGMTLAAAYAEIESLAGKQFDPQCVRAFVNLRPRLEALWERESSFRQQTEMAMDTVSIRELKRHAAGSPSSAPPGSVTVPSPHMLAQGHAQSQHSL